MATYHKGYCDYNNINMSIQDNQIHSAVNDAVGRDATPYELSTLKIAPIQTIANLKDSYSKLNPNSIVDYLTSIGEDPSMQNRQTLGQKYGITNIGTAEGNTALLNVLKSGKTDPTATNISGTVSSAGGTIQNPNGTVSAPVINNGVNQNSNYSFDANGTPISRDEHGNVIQYVPGTSRGTPGQSDYYPGDKMPDQSTQNAVNGSIAGAAGSAGTDASNSGKPPIIPEVSTSKDAYTQAQQAVVDVTSKIADINKSIDSAMANKRDEIARSGGVVDESQLRSTVLAENAPLLAERNTLTAQRTQLVGEQNIAAKSYSDAVAQQKESDANFYKSQTLAQGQAKITQAQQKIDVQQQQFTQKEQDVATKLGQSGYKLAKGTDPATGAATNYWTRNPGATSGFDTSGKPVSISQNPQGDTTVAPKDAPSNTNTSNPNGLSVAQYGLLANVKDFKPDSSVTDKEAYTYLMNFLGGGSQTSASRSALTAAVNATITSRAATLYSEATGGLKLPSKNTIDTQNKNITSNNNLLNQLDVQTGTISKNFGLNLENMTANNINTAKPIFNGLLDYIAQSSGSPSVAQYLSQHETLANELSSLLAVKNAGGGTTVADKLSSQDLLPANSNIAQAKQILQTLMTEANNQQNTILNTNAKAYIKIDGLGINPENPVNKTITLTDSKGNVSDPIEPNTMTPQQLNSAFSDGYEINSQQ